MSRSERETERPTVASAREMSASRVRETDLRCRVSGITVRQVRLGWACLTGSGGQFLLFRPWGLMLPEQPLVSERLKSAGGRIALSHKGRYWQISGLKSRWHWLRLFISARGECSKGDFSHCSVCEALGAYPCFRRALAARSLLSYTAGGAGGTPSIVARPTAWLVDQT